MNECNYVYRNLSFPPQDRQRGMVCVVGLQNRPTSPNLCFLERTCGDPLKADMWQLMIKSGKVCEQARVGMAAALNVLLVL